MTTTQPLREAGTGVRLRVLDSAGMEQSLHMPGLDEHAAMRQARARGWRVLGVEALASAPAEPAGAGEAGPRLSLLLFSQELLALLNAGLTLPEALSALVAKERSAAARQVLQGVLGGLEVGRNFSDVLETLPAHFPPIYVATIRAAERTGDLPQALRRYVGYQQQFEELRKKLVSAAIYPAMLLVVGTFVMLFLLGYVVPRFSVVYESAGKDMPWLSMLLLQFGKALYAHWALGLAAVACVIGGIGLLLARAQGRAWLLGWVLRVPVLARKAQEFRLARFYRALGLLLVSGISLPRALGMVRGLLDAQQQGRLQDCLTAVTQGRMFSDALIAAGLANPIAESLIKVGERSGQLADMLERSAQFADDEFARWVDWASRLLEPLLMTLIGAVIGTVVVLMYMPIFDMANSLQ